MNATTFEVLAGIVRHCVGGQTNTTACGFMRYDLPGPVIIWRRDGFKSAYAYGEEIAGTFCPACIDAEGLRDE